MATLCIENLLVGPVQLGLESACAMDAMRAYSRRNDFWPFHTLPRRSLITIQQKPQPTWASSTDLTGSEVSDAATSLVRS
jgi:hypothetical protein